MGNPAELKYTKDHEWVRIEGNTATVGITDYAQGQLGDIVFVDIDTEGDELEQMGTFGSIEAVKTVSDLFMPLSGTVAEFNPALEDKPELINQDPYGEGWIVKIELSKTEELADLLSAEKYDEMINA